MDNIWFFLLIVVCIVDAYVYIKLKRRVFLMEQAVVALALGHTIEVGEEQDE